MNKTTILVIEDEADLREAIVTTLQTANFTVVQAEDGEDGYHKALKLHPDVILLDILLPKMNGHEVLRKLRDDIWGQHAKIIMLTNERAAEDIADAVYKNTEQYLVKSHVSLVDIVKKVKQVLVGY